jgi:hypothetical protein
MSMLASARNTGAPGRVWLAAATALACAAGLGCGSSPSTNGDAAVGGAITGPADNHCSGVTPIVVNSLSCSVTTPPDAGAQNDDAGTHEEMAATLFNAEGADDDCKFHVSFTTMPAVKLNTSVTFKVTVTKLADGTPATGAVNAQGDGVAIEGFVDSTTTVHVLPNTTPPTTASETPAGSGVYTIGPVKFDASGRWIVRFHLYETCTDVLEDSPHGHVAFFFDVP